MNGLRLIVSCIAMTAALAAPAPALGQAPSLTGEELLSRDFEGFPIPDSGVVDITATVCNPDGSGSFSFFASGVATGPYPGPYEETGSYAFGPEDLLGNSTVTAFTATFSIDSPAGQVDGTKTIGAVPATAQGCLESGGDRFFAGGGVADYDAAIVLPDGRRCTDAGTAEHSTTLNDFASVGSSSENFFEGFTSGSPTAVCPPATPAECTRENAVAAGFKNRGDCVSFLATGGRNEPGKNERK